MPRNKIIIVVVLYNESLFETNAYKTLLKGYQDSVFVYDNSPIPQHSIAEFPSNWIYISDPCNSGLSIAYNQAAKYAVRNDYEWLFITDQDTIYVPNIIQDFDLSINEYPEIKLFVPKMCIGNTSQYMSPIDANPIKAKIVDYVPKGVQSLYEYAPINSGMMINIKAFWKVGGYNENVKVDFSDYQFISRFRRAYNEFYILDKTCKQEFSNNIQTPNQKLVRFEKFCESLKCYECADWRESILIFLVVLRRTLSLMFYTRSLNPIKIYIKKFIV